MIISLILKCVRKYRRRHLREFYFSEKGKQSLFIRKKFSPRRRLEKIVKIRSWRNGALINLSPKEKNLHLILLSRFSGAAFMLINFRIFSVCDFKLENSLVKNDFSMQKQMIWGSSKEKKVHCDGKSFEENSRPEKKVLNENICW